MALRKRLTLRSARRAPLEGSKHASIHPATLLLFLRVGGYLHLDDAVGVDHRARARIALFDRIDVLHSLGHLTDDGVLAVEEIRFVEADEELAVGGIGIVGARHSDGAAHEVRLTELRLELMPRAARAGAGGIAGLRHETRDHPMEFKPVIKALSRESLYLRHREGRQ